MTDQVRIEVCGRLCLHVGDRVATEALPGRQGRLALTYLALHRDRPVSRDELANAIWGERSPQRVTGSLNALVSKLRRALGQGTLEGSSSLQLAAGVAVDVDEARRALAEGRRQLAAGALEQARERAATAAALAGRGLVVDHEAEWLEDPRRDLAELRLQALECAGEAALGLGGHALADAERLGAALTTAAPFRESGSLLRMRACAAQGNVAEAVRVYHALRRRLDDELGLLPGPRVQAQLDTLLAGEGPAGAPASRERPPAIPLPRLSTRTHARFVGRETELARLEALLAEVRLGGRRLVALEGEPGIGKTRMAEQFAAMASRSGATVLAGRCDPTAFVPYQPFVQALRPYLATIPPAGRRERLGVHAEELACVLPDLAARGAPREPGAGRAERCRLFDAIGAVLAEVTALGPTVLILDDLHWADRPTLLLLRHIVGADENTPLLLVGTYRPTERPAHLLDTLADLHPFEAIRLTGLRRRDAARLVSTLGEGVLPADTGRALWRETRGNPFHLEEIVRDTVARRHAAPVLPEGVRAVIRRRLARCSDDVGHVLAVAAAVGQDFSLDVLERVRDLADLPEDRLDAALDEAVAAQVIVEIPDDYGHFAFAHSLMRQTIYEDLTLTRRARLHLRIGEALETLPGRPPAELAHHFLAAPPSRTAEKAIRYATDAGEEAMRVLAFEEAERLYGRALATLERFGTGGPEERRRLLLALGDVEVRLGSGDAARTTYAQVLTLARDDGDAEAFAVAALGLGAGSPVAGGVVDDMLVAVLEEALVWLPRADGPLRARLLARLAGELSASDQHVRCAALSEEAVTVARRAGDPGALAFALGARHRCLWEPPNLEARLAAARELLALAHRTGKRASAVEGHRWCLLDLLERGDIPAVDAERDAYAALASGRRLASELWYVPLFDAMRRLLDGRLDDVERIAAEALGLGRRVAPARAEQAHTLQLFALRREQRRLGEMGPAVRACAQRYPAIAGWRCVLAFVYAATGRAGRATEELDALAADGFAGIPHDGLWLGALGHLAETCAALGVHAHAASLYALLEPYGERNVVIGSASACAGSAARHLGLLATLLGESEIAAAHFERALDMNRRMGARPWLARTQVQYAETLLAGPRRDPARALELLDAALGCAHGLGLTDISARAATALECVRRRPAAVGVGR